MRTLRPAAPAAPPLQRRPGFLLQRPKGPGLRQRAGCALPPGAPMLPPPAGRPCLLRSRTAKPGRVARQCAVCLFVLARLLCLPPSLLPAQRVHSMRRCSQNAVGWADDPTGGFDRNEAFKASGGSWGGTANRAHHGVAWRRPHRAAAARPHAEGQAKLPHGVRLPISSTNMQGGFGSRVPVTLGECALACQGAPGCDAFTYNAVQQGCFLKTAQCPLRNNCQASGECAGHGWQQGTACACCPASRDSHVAVQAAGCAGASPPAGAPPKPPPLHQLLHCSCQR